mgnify:CR=1 FL=1
MIKPTPVLALAGFVFFASSKAYSQLNLSKWQVGANVGAFIYQGDLTPSPIGSYRTASPGFGLHISRVLSPSFLARTNFQRANLKGDDAVYASPSWRRDRNFMFSTPVTEISELLVWNIFRNTQNQQDRKFSPYVFAGAGVSLLRVNRDYSRMNKAIFTSESQVISGLAVDMAHRTPRALLVLPVGAGVEYNLSPHISLTAETSFRYTFTDYLDGFSQSANPKRKDYYHSHTIGLIYKFQKKNQWDCPAMRY